MSNITFDSIQVDDQFPILTKSPITRTTLALFAGASNDHNAVHIDIDFAKEAGMDDVFAHGMLSMAYLGQLLTDHVPASNIRSFDVRFIALTHVGDEITCAGKVVEKYSENNKNFLKLLLEAKDQKNEVKLSGGAVLELP